MKPLLSRLRRPTVPTLATVITRYLAEVSPKKKSLSAEQSIARTWLATRLAGRPINRIRNTDLIEIRDAWLTDKAAATVVRRLAFLSHVYTVLRKDWGWTELANPVELVRRPTVNDARDRRLYKQIRMRGVDEDECPREELEWILQSTGSEDLPTIAIIASETGMRRSEVTLLRREQINMIHGVISLDDTKNGSARQVPMTPWAKEIMRQHLAEKPLRGRIFTIQPGSVTRAWIRACRRARARYEALCRKHGRRPHPTYFNGLRLHDLRHEGTSELATVFEMHELAKVNGNKDTRMLLRYYHPSGIELARKLARSPLGRRQLALIRNERFGQFNRRMSREGGQRPPESNVQ
jgi:integrase